MRENRKRVITLLGHSRVVLMLALMLLVAAWTIPMQAQAASAKIPDKIRIGNAIALSGPYAPGAITT